MSAHTHTLKCWYVREKRVLNVGGRRMKKIYTVRGFKST